MADLTVATAMRALRACKDSVDVARLLRAANPRILATRNCEHECPIAQYVGDILGDRGSVYVFGMEMAVRRDGCCDWSTFDTPDAVVGFESEFDRGEWPEFTSCPFCGGRLKEARLQLSARCCDCGEITYVDCHECGCETECVAGQVICTDCGLSQEPDDG